jgi:GntR family transcriptional regulator, transcriptional repressor for pyruvate dehydrogenase complex
MAMATTDVGREARRRLTSPRIAETVADELRRQIVDGELADGDLLPPQAVLVERFNVSLVSLREALRILETEGLVSVRRGNQGGAVVHAPTKSSAAYMLGLVLQSEHVGLDDLGAALNDLEPTCAAMAAQRSDRIATIVPELQRLNAAMSECLDDGSAFADLDGQFHNAVVMGSGNSTMVAVVGSLETLWRSHNRPAGHPAAGREFPSDAERRAILKAHTALTDAIEIGDPERARRIASSRLADAQTYAVSAEGQRIIATSPQVLARTRDWHTR